MKILHIEDDVILTNLVKTFLSHDEVLTVIKLSDAIELLNKETFDFLIVDLHLEDSLPNQTLTLLDDYDIPKIIVTVDDDEQLMESALLLDYPPMDYVLKQDYPGIHLIRKIKFNVDKVRREHEKSSVEPYSFFDKHTFEQIKLSICEPINHKHLMAH